MAAWLPAAKIILPHVANIVSVAVPVFTKRRADSNTPVPADVQQQITELQTAAAQNTAYIKELAEQLEAALRSLEAGAKSAQSKIRRAYATALVGFGVGLISLIFSMVALLNR